MFHFCLENHSFKSAMYPGRLEPNYACRFWGAVGNYLDVKVEKVAYRGYWRRKKNFERVAVRQAFAYLIFFSFLFQVKIEKIKAFELCNVDTLFTTKPEWWTPFFVTVFEFINTGSTFRVDVPPWIAVRYNRKNVRKYIKYLPHFVIINFFIEGMPV